MPLPISSNLFTRKQLWRRQKKHLCRQEYDMLYEQDLIRAKLNCDGDSSYGECPAKSIPIPTTISQSILTTDSMKLNHKKLKKSVNFTDDDITSIQYIPTRDEYVNDGLANILWWSNTDYYHFKECALNEIRTIMQINNRIDIKTAQSILYQPTKEMNKSSSRSPKITENKKKSILGNSNNIEHVNGKTHTNNNHVKPVCLTNVISQVDLQKFAAAATTDSISFDMKASETPSVTVSTPIHIKSVPKSALHFSDQHKNAHPHFSKNFQELADIPPFHAGTPARRSINPINIINVRSQVDLKKLDTTSETYDTSNTDIIIQAHDIDRSSSPHLGDYFI